jgi:hypothetical protein
LLRGSVFTDLHGGVNGLSGNRPGWAVCALCILLWGGGWVAGMYVDAPYPVLVYACGLLCSQSLVVFQGVALIPPVFIRAWAASLGRTRLLVIAGSRLACGDRGCLSLSRLSLAWVQPSLDVTFTKDRNGASMNSIDARYSHARSQQPPTRKPPSPEPNASTCHHLRLAPLSCILSSSWEELSVPMSSSKGSRGMEERTHSSRSTTFPP